MNDSVLVEALRARDPGALAALYDSYAESIYRFCLSSLGGLDSAQVALRDTLIAAEAHIHALTDPARLRPWLYALARLECVRRGGRPVAGPSPAFEDAGDADLRLISWNATMSLPEADREILDLATTHNLSVPDIALVVGLPERRAQEAHDTARDVLHDAVSAELIVRKGPYDCPERARILSGFAGDLTRTLRERVIRHLQGCQTCAPHRRRQVSAAKVFNLLPAATVPETLRVRVMSCFVDPELVPYRRYVARRVGPLDAAGFPVGGAQRDHRGRHALVGVVAAVAAVIAGVLVSGHLGQTPQDAIASIASGAFPPTGEPPGIRLPWQPKPEWVPVELEPMPQGFSVRPQVYRSVSPSPTWRTSAPTDTPAPGPRGKRSARPPAPPSRAPERSPLRPEERPSPREHHNRPRPRPAPSPKPTSPPAQPPTPTPTPAPTKPPTQSPTQPQTPTPTPTVSSTPEPTPTSEPSQ
ncbi:hypothetical protein [Streptosporangium sp. KLBMP 9127]|nr:hypothetical protein [Streptosporangium sp. KLBMP 9127]